MWTAKDREKYKDDGRRYPSDLTDTEWATIATLFSGCFTFTADIREMVNACFYLEHTGCQWRALPRDFGPWQTVRTWHDRFRADGIWADVTAQLTRTVRKARGRTAEPGSWTRRAWCPGRRRASAATTATRRSRACPREGGEHQAPCPDLLAGLRPGDRGHGGQCS